MANPTDLGKFLKKMRIDYGENMTDMATKLTVSSSFLSSVETGKRKIPSNMITKICDLYKLSESQKTVFFDAIASSGGKVDISLEEGATERNALAVSFVADLQKLDDHQLEEIRKILRKEID